MPKLSHSLAVLFLLCASALAQKIEVITPGGKRAVTMSGGATINATGVVTLNVPPVSSAGQLTFTYDGGGQPITTGFKGYWPVEFACTITKVTLTADVSGSVVVDIWKDTFVNAPPTVADTITASAKPTLTASAKSSDAVLTGWNKTITAGDAIGFNIDSTSGVITRLVVTLAITK